LAEQGEKDGAAPGSGDSTGTPAAGQHDAGHSYSPAGGSGVRHWQTARISEPDLSARGGVFFAAVEMTRMPMVVTDPNLPDNPIVFVNGAFLDLTGYEEEEIIGRNCRFLQGARSDREMVGEVREAIEARRAISVELLNYRKDGTPFWNALFMGPIFDREGRLLYFFASQLDVTRRRTSEQAFRQAQKMEAIGQLTAGLAHDFNNLLQIVVGNLQTAVEQAASLAPGDAGDALRNAVAGADRATQQAAKLTQQLLAFARKTRLEPKSTDLNGLVTEFSGMLARTLGDRVSLRLDLAVGTPPCTLDPVHLEMALLNVLLNARDAMPDGGGAIISTARVHMSEADARAHRLTPGTYVALGVRDEGHGMLPEVLERATEPFFTTKSQGQGTGLGLAMVHGFVQQSGGRIEIESEPRRGTTVRLLFPVGATAAPTSPPAPAIGGIDSPPDEKVSSTGGPETVLVVDDNAEVLALAAGQLARVGYRVLTAVSGEAALDVIEREEGAVDLLFTDLVMPGGMGGLALAERVRERVPGIGVLLTTAYLDELTAHGPRAPAMDVLGKPYRQTDLTDRVRAALNQRRRRAAPDGPPSMHPVQPKPPGPRHEG
jgi:PAS domain S-box-containing protein